MEMHGGLELRVRFECSPTPLILAAHNYVKLLTIAHGNFFNCILMCYTPNDMLANNCCKPKLCIAIHLCKFFSICS